MFSFQHVTTVEDMRPRVTKHRAVDGSTFVVGELVIGIVGITEPHVTKPTWKKPKSPKSKAGGRKFFGSIEPSTTTLTVIPPQRGRDLDADAVTMDFIGTIDSDDESSAGPSRTPRQGSAPAAGDDLDTAFNFDANETGRRSLTKRYRLNEDDEELV